MAIDINALPSDIKSFILDLNIQLEQQRTELKAHCLEIEKLRHQLQVALMKRFGRSSEQLTADQLRLFDELIDKAPAGAAEAERATVAVASHERQKQLSRALPKNLVREIVEHDLLESEKTCSCGQALHCIGEDHSEKLDIVPAQVKVIEHIRYKYACRACEVGIKAAPLAQQPIPKSMATPGLLAYVLVSKYAGHLPLYRQEKIFQRMGIDLKRGTLCEWALRCAELLTPLVKQLQTLIIRNDYVQADETPVQVLKSRDNATTRRGYMWVYRGGESGAPALVYDYQSTRHGEHVMQFLSEFKGKLQTDGYSGYNAFTQSQFLVHAACWQHAKRKFMDIVKTTKQTGKAHQAVGFINKLYAIEKEARSQRFDSDQRAELRQARASPIVEKLKMWLDRSIEQVPPQSPIGKAIAYTLKLWPKLIIYLQHGEIEIDTNLVENAIRPFALGRRNWLCVSRRRCKDEILLAA